MCRENINNHTCHEYKLYLSMYMFWVAYSKINTYQTTSLKQPNSNPIVHFKIKYTSNEKIDSVYIILSMTILFTNCYNGYVRLLEHSTGNITYDTRCTNECVTHKTCQFHKMCNFSVVYDIPTLTFLNSWNYM